MRSKGKQLSSEILSHWDELFRFLRKMTGDDDTACDLCQDVFLKVLQKWLEGIGFTDISLVNDPLASQDQIHNSYPFPALFYMSGIKKSDE